MRDASWHIQNDLGTNLQDQGRVAEAVAAYRRAVELKPDFADAHNNLGTALQDLGRIAEAGACYRRALEFQPNFAEAHSNLGNVYKAQGSLAEAIACYRRALHLAPELADAHNNLGAALEQQGNLSEALVAYEQAVRLRPDFAEAHWNRAQLWLLAGDFGRGWPEYEWRWRIRGLTPPSLSQPIWDGRPLRGKTILLHAEQGLGDTFQFIRYARAAKHGGGRVIVLCQKPLRAILGGCREVDQLVDEATSSVSFDVWCSLMSLPRVLGTTLETIPAAIPYLAAAPDLLAQWDGRLRGHDGFRIGIGWQGHRRYHRDRDRSIPLHCFASLASIPRVRLVSLQKNAGREQMAEVAFPVADLGDEVDGASGPFMDTAAIMLQMDLVITSDTALAHLAGALGVPVWVALPVVPDWRWMLHRADSPWYPTMRLFRQETRGDWRDVFDNIRNAVQALMR
jgi:hypothetical protein